MKAPRWISALVFLLLFPSASPGSVLDTARPHLPTLIEAVVLHWPGAPCRENFAGQVEQESRWKTAARLKTSREDGRGLVQLTVAYDAAGKERFNAFRDAMAFKALRSWDYRKDPENVKFQLSYLVLMDRSNFRQFEKYFDDDVSRWAAALVAYNAGAGTVIARRRVGVSLERVNTRKWFGNGLESCRLSYESRKLYGRDLGEMRNEYPRLIIKTRAPKYKNEMN